MGDFEVAQRIEELLGAEAEPSAKDTAVDAVWERQMRVHLLLNAQFASPAVATADTVYASIRAAGSASRRERIADVIGRRTGRGMSRRRSWRHRLAPLAAAALIMVLVLVGYRLIPLPAPLTPEAAPVLALTRLGQGLVLERDGHRLMPDAGMTLRAGDLLTSAATGSELVFADGSHLQLAGGSRISVVQAAPDKTLRLYAGGLTAEVTHQSADTPLRIHAPNSLIEIVGTRFTLATEPVGVHLLVDDGTVRLTRPDNTDGVLVATGQQAVVSSHRPPVLVQPLDLNRLRTRVAVPCDDAAAWPNLLASPISADVRREGVEESAFLHFVLPRTDRYVWGSRGMALRLQRGDRALRLRVRVLAAAPDSRLGADTGDDVGNMWRIGGWPLVAGAGWQTLIIPFPAAEEPPPRTFATPDHQYLIERCNIFWLYFSNGSEVDVAKLEILSETFNDRAP